MMKSAINKVVVQLFLPYLAVLVFAICISFVAYFIAYREIESSVRENYKTLLASTIDSVDQAIEEISNLTFSVAQNDDVNRFLIIADYLNPANHVFMMNLQKNLPPYQITNNLVFDYYVHFKKSDVVISPATLSFRLPSYYENSLKYQGIDYKEWYSLCFDSYHKDEILPPVTISQESRSYSLLSYLQSIPIGYQNIYEGTILVLLKEDVLSRMLSSLLFTGEGWIVVVDAEGHIVASLDSKGGRLNSNPTPNIMIQESFGFFETTIAGEDVQVSYMRSEITGWTFIASVPRKALQARVIYIRRIAYVIVIITVCLGALFALLLANRTGKPIQTALNSLRARDADVAAYEKQGMSSLQLMINKLILRTDNLDEELRRHEPMVRAAMFERLIRGEITEKTEIESLCDVFCIDPDSNRFLCLIIHLRGYRGILDTKTIRELNLVRMAVRENIGRLFGTCSHDSAIDTITIILPQKDVDEQTILNSAERLIRQLGMILISEYGISIAVSGGNPVSELNSIYISFNQAKETMAPYPVNSQNGIFWYSTEVSGDRYYYPLEIERVLLNSLTSGNMAKAEEVLDLIQNQNFASTMLSPAMSHYLFTEIRGTLFKCLNSRSRKRPEPESIQTDLIELEQTESVSAFFAQIKTICNQICTDFNAHKKSHNTELLETIRNLILNNFSDPGMGLPFTAEKTGLSEVYISQFFKEQTGENFISALTRVRISTAEKILIENPELPIQSIARKVGYANTDTFRKAFRRMCGISPKDRQVECRSRKIKPQ